MLNGGEQPPFGRFRHLERQLSQVQGGLVEHVAGLRLAGTKTKSQKVGQRSAGRQRDALPRGGSTGPGLRSRRWGGSERAPSLRTASVPRKATPAASVDF